MQSPKSAAQTNELKTQEQVLAYGEFQKARADLAEQARDQWKAQAAENFALYQSEHQRAEILKSANGDRQEAASQTGLVVSLLRDQVASDKEYIGGVESKLSRCEGSKWKWAIGSFGVGVVTGFLKR